MSHIAKKETGEHYESFYSHTVKKELIQYDWREKDGKLYSCIASSLKKARNMRDKWRKKNGYIS